MLQQTKQSNKKILAWICGIYLIPVIVAVLYAWFREGYPLDLSLTVSLYVARYPWSTVLFFFHATVVCLLILRYLGTRKITILQRILYYLVLLCIMGCAIFPCNRSRSEFTTEIHDFLSYVLVIAVALTFAGMLVFARQKAQRIFATGSLIFAIIFIVVFAARVPAVKDTIFIWENVVMLLFLLELYFEQHNPDTRGSANHPSP